jgi:Cupin.
MQVSFEKVINPVEENAVIDGTTIMNTIYDYEGYRISHISMSKGTFVSPERFRSPTMLYVNKGQLRVSVFNKENKREAVVKEGQAYFRPSKEFAGYYADDSDVIVTEIVLNTNSAIAMRIIPHAVQDLIHLVHYEPGQVSCSHLVSDPLFQMNMYAYSELERKANFYKEQPVIIECMEGQLVIAHEEDKYVLNKGDMFAIPANYTCDISASSRTKIIVLYLCEEL